MCCPGCHHLLAKLPGTPGKLLVHASYSLLGMYLERVFQLDPFFLFRTLQLCKMVHSGDWGSTAYLTRLLILCSNHITAFCSAYCPSLQHWSGGYRLRNFSVQDASSLSALLATLLSSQEQGMVLGAEQHCVLKNGPWKMQVYRGYFPASQSKKLRAEKSRAAEGRSTEKEQLYLCNETEM